MKKKNNISAGARSKSTSATSGLKHKGTVVNSRAFLASSQCQGDKSSYLFAFGGEI